MPETWPKDLPLDTNPARFFLFTTGRHWKPAVVAMLAVTSAGIFAAVAAYCFKLISNAAIQPGKDSFQSALIWSCGLYVMTLALEKTSWRVSGFSGSLWATGTRATARQVLTAYVTLHSRTYFSNRFAGSLANKIGQASEGMVDAVELFLWSFLELAIAALTSLVIAFLASPVIAAIFLVWVVTVAVLNYHFAKKRTPLSAQAQRLETGLNGATVDLLSNITSMQEYAQRSFEMQRLENAIRERRNAGLRNWRFSEKVLVLNNVLQTIFGTLMLIVAIYMAVHSLISPGDVVLVITIIFRIESFLQNLGANVNRASNLWGQIAESLKEIVEPHEIPDRTGATSLHVTSGKIDFQDVDFSYPEMRVFENFSLHIPAGQRVGLVGRSGSGKSTLVRLLLHHHEIQSGGITIDDTDIASVTQESLRRKISIVPQEPLLFHRTIAANISYGRPEATHDEIVAAAALAQADAFIRRLPHAYESMVGERGIKLSGGERQRIAIARAILKNAPILLLDEATSALDSESEVAIQTALHRLMERKTVIAIAHRLSTLREMDRIIVLDKGVIVEDGTHEALLKNNKVYADLWQHQAGGFLQEG